MLRLPLEIRTKIWKEVLGNRLVHIEYYLDDGLDFTADEEYSAGCYSSDEFEIQYRNTWAHLICQDDGPENREDEKMTLSDGEVYEVRIHQFCSPPSQPLDPAVLKYCDDRNEMMHLTLLRACRQIYVEANSTLWTNNTFSFGDPITFKHFMMTRNIHQKRMIRKLRLDFSLDLARIGASWESALNMAVIRSMSGLRCLRVRLDNILEASHYKYAKNYNPLSYFHDASLERLSTLPLTEVEVDVRNPQHHHLSSLWTKEDREEFADALRGALLDPMGASIYAEEQREEKEWRRRQRERMAETKASRRPARAQNVS